MPDFNELSVASPPQLEDVDAFRGIPNPLVYKASVHTLRVVLGTHIHGIENIPDEPAVYLPSHRSRLDIPPLAISIYSVKNEPVRFMAKKDMKVWKLPLIGGWFRSTGVLQITQNRDHANIDEMRPFIDAAKDGQNVVTYAEGVMGEGPIIGPVLPGALLIAALAKRPIVPVGISGTRPFKFRRFHAVFGETIPADEVYKLRRAKAAGTEVLRQQLQVAFNEANSYLK